jgi:hypothetical protein
MNMTKFKAPIGGLGAFFMFALFFQSCNQPIEVSPIEKTTVSTAQPDFNFLATSAFEIGYPNAQFQYKMPIELYLRPFENVNDNTNFVLEFSSNQFAQFVLLRDTLQTGDKIKISYKQFKNYRLVGEYQSQIAGNHNLDFKISAVKVSKTAQLGILMK